MSWFRMMRVAIFLAIVVKEAELNSWSNRFLKLEQQEGHGDVLATRTVTSLVTCGSFCEASGCDGFNVEAAEGSFICTSLAAVTNVTANSSMNFYCAGCYLKGEKCSSDDDCTFLTARSYCEPLNGTCSCVSWCMDDGPDCVPRPVDLGQPCEKDEQCLASALYSLCEEGICKCQTPLLVDGNRCKYDYADQGFQSYNGRWVKMKAGTVLGITWDDGKTYCDDFYSVMMRPLTKTEFTWMADEAKAIFNTAIHLGVNDKATEGQFVWNDGTSVSGDPAIVWTLGIEGALNTPLFQCVGVTWADFPFDPLAGAIACGIPIPFSAVFCESIPELE